MSFGLTYGSFGDVITTVQLVHRLAQALSETRGSARELQNLVVELRLFQNVLQQLIFFWESRRQCVELEQLANIARPAIYDCKETIEAFLERAMRNYGKALLRRKGSRKTFWDVVKAIQWNLCEVEDVEKLRHQLSRSMAIIQMVQIQAHAIAKDLDHAAVSDRIASLVDAERQADAKLDARFAELMENLEEGARTMSRIEEVSSAVFSTVSSISHNVMAIRSTILSMEQVILMLPGMMSRLSLFKQNIAYIEDALGWNLPILLDAHPSWETVHSTILDQFVRHGSPGLDIVRLRRYALHNSITGKDANSKIPFYQMARPGQTYAMSMLFHGNWNAEDETLGNGQESKCLKCGHVNSVTGPDVDVICQNTQCDLIYRRVVDVSHMDDRRLEEWVKDSSKRQMNLHNNDEDEEDDNTDSQHQEIETVGQKDSAISETVLDDPEIFKRVRLLSSWEHRMESRGILYASVGDIHIWDTSSIGSVVEAEIQMHISIIVHLRPYLDWILAGRRPNEIERWEYRFFTGFVGRTREQSSPLLLLILESKRARRRISRAMKRLDWLGIGSRFSVITAAPSVFGKKEFDENWESNRMNPKWFEVKTEVRRRMKMLSYEPN